MTDSKSSSAPQLGALPTPGLITRARFFASRHPIAVAVPLAIIIAFGVATVAALGLGVPSQRKAAFIPGVAAISLTAIGAAIFPLVARMQRTASSRDIAAAMIAATDRERPHLLAEIEGRLSNPHWRAPMTVFQLVMMFREVRQTYGERAYRKHCREQAARAQQETYVAQLAADG